MTSPLNDPENREARSLPARASVRPRNLRCPLGRDLPLGRGCGIMSTTPNPAKAVASQWANVKSLVQALDAAIAGHAGHREVNRLLHLEDIRRSRSLDDAELVEFWRTRGRLAQVLGRQRAERLLQLHRNLDDTRGIDHPHVIALRARDRDEYWLLRSDIANSLLAERAKAGAKCPEAGGHTVLQSDRDAAAKLRPYCGETVLGLHDSGSTVQAFARHREASTAELLEALKELVRWSHFSHPDTASAFRNAGADIANATGTAS